MSGPSKILSATLIGIDAYLVEVEVDVLPGLPNISVVGLPQVEVKESRERVMSAIRNSGFEFPYLRIVINLAPAAIRKRGAMFDLPIAAGILGISGDVDMSRLAGFVVMGELSLTGKVRGIPGVLSMALAAKKNGARGVIVPAENIGEARVVKELEVVPVENLGEFAEWTLGKRKDEPDETVEGKRVGNGCNDPVDCVDRDGFSLVKGQQFAKRALMIAAAGGHNILLSGPPGAGKTMLARALVSIMPPMTRKEAIETTMIYSALGEKFGGHFSLMSARPFRAPHHSISLAGMTGGGDHAKPGELSLAHNGVLFLDELPEFRRDVLESLRQPMEERRLRLSRATYSVDLPAGFTLVAAMNPCPCGYFTHPTIACTCNPGAVARYLARISGPLLDRIDLQVEVQSPTYEEISSSFEHVSSIEESISVRISQARERQQFRLRGYPGLYTNAMMNHGITRKTCKTGSQAEALMAMLYRSDRISARMYDRILRVSRTIADLDDSDKIKEEHVAEAIQYRSIERRVHGVM